MEILVLVVLIEGLNGGRIGICVHPLGIRIEYDPLCGVRTLDVVLRSDGTAPSGFLLLRHGSVSARLFIALAHLGIGSEPVVVAVPDGQFLKGVDVSDGDNHDPMPASNPRGGELQRRIARCVDVSRPIAVYLCVDEDRIVVIAGMVACWETLEFHSVGLVRNGACALQLAYVFVENVARFDAVECPDSYAFVSRGVDQLGEGTVDFVTGRWLAITGSASAAFASAIILSADRRIHGKGLRVVRVG